MDSQYVKWYAKIEKELFSFFYLFDGLCSSCYAKTIEQVDVGNRKKRKLWCCCLIDNQVHGYWPQLNALQLRFNKKWHSDLKLNSLDLKRSLPGEGPCPALGINGCMLSHHRPLTCTTQLCEKMLFVLNELKIVNVSYYSPLQIEDIIELPDIVEVLYGIKVKAKRVSKADINRYLHLVSSLKRKFAKIDVNTRNEAINKSILLMEK